MGFFRKEQEPVENNPKQVSDALIAQLSKQPFYSKLFSKKIECRLWLLGKGKQRDKLIGIKKVSVGARHFTFKGMRFYIDYKNLREGKKSYIYDTDILNAVGGLSFHDRQETVDSKQAEIMLQDGAVELFIKKGGIPAWYLLICVVGIVALAGVIAFVVPDYLSARDIITTLTSQNADLRSQVAHLQQSIGGTTIVK